MSYRFKNALRASLEDDAAVSEDLPAATDEAVEVAVIGEPEQVVEEVQVLPAEDADAVIVDTTDSMEEAIAAQDDAEAVVDEVVEQKEELEEAAAGLESIYNELAAIRKTGKTDRTTLKIANLAVESYTKRLGLDGTPMISVESFNSQLSMETIGETLKKIWDAIVQAVRNIRDAIWNLLKRIFTAAGRLKARGERLGKLRLTGDAKTSEFTIKGLGRRIAVGTHIETDPVKGLAALSELIKECSAWDEEVQKESLKAAEFVKKLVASKDRDELLAVNERFGGPKGFKETKVGTIGTKFTSPVMPGNVVFTATFDRDESAGVFKTGVKLLRGASFRKEQQDAKVPEEVKVSVLKPDKITETAKALDNFFKEIKKAQDSSEKIARDAKQLGSYLKTMGHFDAKLSATQTAVLRYFRIVASMPGQLTSKVCAHAIGVASTYVQLAEKSATQYAKAKGGNESYSEEGFSGAILGGALAAMAGATFAPFVAAAVGGHLVQRYLKLKAKERELALKVGKDPSKSGAEVAGEVAKELIRTRNERLKLEHEITAKAKAADAKKNNS